MDMPRLSVDIDLAYCPLKDRGTSLSEIGQALEEISVRIESLIDGVAVTPRMSSGRVVRLVVKSPVTQIKIEPNLILRGSVEQPAELELCDAAKRTFDMFVSTPCVSTADLYAGKLCAALDRQHPRDLFDVKLLLDDTGITPEIRRGFVVYLAACNRPMHELLAPQLHNMADAYNGEFQGMARIELPLGDLEAVQRDLAPALVSSLDDDERRFLLSMKAGDPDWDILAFENLQAMPALQWKLINIRKMDKAKRADQLRALQDILWAR